MWEFPLKLNLFGQSILLHGVFEFLGIFIAFRYYLYLSRKQNDGISQDNRLWIIVAATFGAIIGSRFVGSLELAYQIKTTPDKLAYFWGNKTILGGLLGGLIFVELIKSIIREKQSSGDLITFPLILGMVIGRIGCFTAGVSEETYGINSSLPWAVNYGDGIMRHPVTIYEIFFLILIWVGLIRLEKKYTLTKGSRFKIFIILYCMFRFLLDFIKPGWRYFMGLGTIQITALLGILYYIRYITKPVLLIKNRH